MVRRNGAPVNDIFFASSAQAIARARQAMELRGDRYLALVDARARLEPGWLDALLLEIESDPRTGIATFAGNLPSAHVGNALLAADARCTLIALRKYPAHHRLEDAPSLDEATARFAFSGWRNLGIGTRSSVTVRAALPPVRPQVTQLLAPDTQTAEELLKTREGRRPGLISIVTLSWNAPEFTQLALESIRAHTAVPHEIIIVDNGSREETTRWLRTLQDVRVIFNAENRGFAAGTNQAFAAARGEYVVMLNNDVIVTAGWLDRLLDAFDRIPGIGISAPRSNKVAGDQQVNDCAYADIDAMHRYARERAQRLSGSGYLTDRAIGLCLCIDRRVLDEVGGFDTCYGVGNFEDDDFCLRVRAAGYKIYVCDDVFIHHFGSQSFAANKVDYVATMQGNWQIFTRKWGYSGELGQGYQPRTAIARGFNRAEHFVPIESGIAAQTRPPHAGVADYRLVFAATVDDESDWNDVGAAVRKFVHAFSAHDNALLAIGALGSVPADAIGERVSRMLRKCGIEPSEAPDIDITEERALDEWLCGLPAAPVRAIAGRRALSEDRLPNLRERSPSAMQRALSEAQSVPV